MITPDLEKWLKIAGYEHYVFISYPRVPQADVMKCALAIADNVRQRFADYVSADKCRAVFVDEHCLPKGQDWTPLLKRALCRSVVFVAVCAPVYYRQEHKWCGREYQAMLALRRLRQAGAVVPLIVRKFKNYPLPEPIAETNYFDLVDEVKTYQNFVRRQKFQNVIDQILELTFTTAVRLRENQANAEPIHPDFQFPEASAFDDYDSPCDLARSDLRRLICYL
jgi:hypothetical protein